MNALLRIAKSFVNRFSTAAPIDKREDAEPSSAIEGFGPFKGLEPFSEADSEYFFGRISEADLIVSNLLGSRLTVLYGPSGVGKSSLLRAGVVGRLRSASDSYGSSSSRHSLIIYFDDWRTHPVSDLKTCIWSSLGTTNWSTSVETTPPAGSLMDMLTYICDELSCDVFMILDQFEEYFIYQVDAGVDDRFADELSRTITSSGLGVNVVIALRDDWLSRLDLFKGDIPQILANYLRLEHMTPSAARSAITEPLRRYNDEHPKQSEQVNLEAGLPDEIIQQLMTRTDFQHSHDTYQVSLPPRTSGDVSALMPAVPAAYLQLVLTRLWTVERQQQPSILRCETLNKLGGSRNIVGTHLETTVDTLSDSEQAVAAKILHFLVTPSGTKLSLSLSSICTYAGFSKDVVKPVLDRLSRKDSAILTRLAAPPGLGNEPWFGVLHDTIAPGVLSWSNRRIQAMHAQEAIARRNKLIRTLTTALMLALVATVMVAANWRITSVEVSKTVAHYKASIQEQSFIRADMLVKQGRLELQEHRPGVALGYSDQALLLKFESSEAHQLRGSALLALGRYTTAIADFNEVVRLGTVSGLTLGMRGECYMRMGLLERARLDFAFDRGYGIAYLHTLSSREPNGLMKSRIKTLLDMLDAQTHAK